MLVWQLALIQIITFTLIILFLRWLLHGHISRALRKLQKLNQENLEREKTLREELTRAKREAQREIEEGRREGKNIKEQGREMAEKEREEIIARARKEAKRLISETERDCQRKKTELALEMQEKAVHLATEMVKYIFTERGREDLHTQLIDELLGEIEKVEKEKVKAEGKNAELICAYKLNDSQKKKLTELLSAKLDREVSLIEREDPEIIAGLVIRWGGFVIDGSIKNKLKRILPLMKEKAKEL